MCFENNRFILSAHKISNSRPRLSIRRRGGPSQGRTCRSTDNSLTFSKSEKSAIQQWQPVFLFSSEVFHEKHGNLDMPIKRSAAKPAKKRARA